MHREVSGEMELNLAMPNQPAPRLSWRENINAIRC